jgi:hypothetical protein
MYNMKVLRIIQFSVQDFFLDYATDAQGGCILLSE